MQNVTRTQYKTIIFDMDGTTLNTKQIWQRADKYILDTYAPHLDTTQKEFIITTELAALYTPAEYMACLQKYCNPTISIEILNQIKSDFVLRFYETQAIDFIPYFQEICERILLHDIICALATNATDKAMHKILQQTPLTEYFKKHIYTIDMVNYAYKPDPAIYLHTAKMLHVEPKECIVIEDTAKGIQAAKAAGMYCIAINTGNDRHALKQADMIIDCYTQLNLEKLLYHTN